MNRNLFARVAANANPDAPLLESVDGRRWRYGEAFARAGRLANALVDLGVGAGDRVAVQVAKSPEALILYLATVRAGAVILPLNPDHTPAELAYFFRDAEPTLIVADPNAAVAAVAGSIPVVTLDAGGDGSLARLAARQRMPSTPSGAATTTSPPSSTPPAPPGGRKGRCSPTTISFPTRLPWSRRGGSPPTTC